MEKAIGTKCVKFLMNNNLIKKCYTSQTIDDVIIYNSTATKGDYVGEIRYIAILENSDKNITVEFSSPSVDETIKLYKSFEFN